MKKLYLALLGILAFTSILGAQATDRALDGMVLDQQGLPIVGARITVTPQEGSAARSVTSGSDRFRLDGLAAGTYDVRVEAAGFEPQELTADLRTQALASIEVRLQPARLSQEI